MFPGMGQCTLSSGMLCLRDSLSEPHILVCMLRMDLQGILEYTDMLLHFLFFGSLHLSHKEMGYTDLFLQLVGAELNQLRF